MTRVRVLYGTFVDTPVLGEVRIRTSTILAVGLGAEDRGKILYVTERPDLSEREDLLDAVVSDTSERLAVDPSQVDAIIVPRTGFVFPGFVDTHIHAAQYPNCGLFGNSTLLDWLEKYTFPLGVRLKDPATSKAVYSAVVQRTLANGTTTAAYYATLHAESAKILAQECSDRGQRALVGKVCMNANSPDYYSETTSEAIEGTRELCNYIEALHDDRVVPIVTPRFAPSCTPSLMASLAQFAVERSLHVQTHLSENQNEIQWVRELFPESQNYTDVYDQAGLLTRRTVLAHCVHLTPQEAKTILRAGSGVSHCPASNSALSSGECKVRWLLDQGIKIGLGTDVSAGYSASILIAARNAHLVSRHLAMKNDESVSGIATERCKLTVLDCLYLATMGGANVLDRQDLIGTFDENKKFDAQMIDLEARQSPIDLFPWEKPQNMRNEFPEDLLHKWLFTGDDRNVTAVWVDGLLCHSLESK